MERIRKISLRHAANLNVAGPRGVVGKGALLLLASLASCADTNEAAEGVGWAQEAEEAGQSRSPARPGSEGANTSRTNVLAQLSLPGDRTLKYVEVGPGAVIEIDTGRTLDEAPTGATEPAGLNFVERYEFLGGEPAPDALVRAQREIDALSEQGEDESEPDRPALVVPASAKSTPEKSTVWPPQGIARWAFLEDYCVATDRTVFWKWVTGHGSFTVGGVNYMKAGARAHTGTIHVLLGYAHYLQGEYIDMNVSAFNFVAVRAASTGNAIINVIITEAEGDIYDMCMNWHY